MTEQSTTDGAIPTLATLADRPSARHTRKRVGRGPGSGRGKTSGRGMKGQKSRSGVALGGFEGGQMPIHMRMPKRGFRNGPFRKRPVPVNLDRIQQALDAGKLPADAVVDAPALIAAGVVRRAPDGVRLLGRGELKAAVRFQLAGASKSATAAVAQAGGSIEIVGGEREAAPAKSAEAPPAAEAQAPASPEPAAADPESGEPEAVTPAAEAVEPEGDASKEASE